MLGEGVGAMTEDVMGGLGLSLRVERPRWSLVSADEMSPAVERLSDLAPASLDAIVMRRPWGDRPEAQHLLTLAHRLLRAGGLLAAADVDAGTLLEGPVANYPTALLWRRADAPSAALRSAALSPAVLSTDAIAARFDAVSISRFDDVLGEYRSMGELWSALRDGGWRGDTWLSPARRASFFDSLPEVLSPRRGPVTDREPWFAVTGVRP